MTQSQNVRQFVTKWRNLAVIVALFGAIASVALPVPTYAATASYSCGSYGAGSYSTSNCTPAAVSAPNTGFAKLLEPTNIMAIVASLALLAIGIAIIIKARRKSRA